MLYDFSYRTWAEDAGLAATAPRDGGRADSKQPKPAWRTTGAGRRAELDADQGGGGPGSRGAASALWGRRWGRYPANRFVGRLACPQLIVFLVGREGLEPPTKRL